jgi:serine/threonine protein kinase
VWHDVQAGTTLIAAGASVVAEAAPTTTLPGARSPFQVAPEIVERGALSSAADLYAVGCMLYELLVGTPPLEGPTHLATIMAHVTLEPEPPSMRAPGIPEGLDEAVLSALAKDPADRPSSASTFADALEPFAATRPRDAAPVGTLSPEIPQEGVAPAPAPPEPADPRRWWTYYDGLERVTTGRWARIYRGRHRPSGELHAIKHLQVASAIDSTEGLKDARAAQAAWRLFQGEMRTLQWLSELQPSVPGLVPLREAYRAEEGHPAYAMPLFPECLGMRIERQGPLPEPEAVMLLMALAQTVGRLHDAEVAHRGISPRSVLLSADGQPHLGGFDTACRLTDQGPLLLAEREVQQTAAPPSATLGDVRFLSPERCRGEAFDHRTDIYSLGALLFYLLVGDAPFSRPDEMQVLLDHVSTPPPRLRACGVAASSVVQEVIDCAMAKAPEQRFSSTVALCSALTRT